MQNEYNSGMLAGYSPLDEIIRGTKSNKGPRLQVPFRSIGCIVIVVNDIDGSTQRWSDRGETSTIRKKEEKESVWREEKEEEDVEWNGEGSPLTIFCLLYINFLFSLSLFLYFLFTFLFGSLNTTPSILLN